MLQRISNTGLSPSPAPVSTGFFYSLAASRRCSYNPAVAVTIAVWATPRSLATTGGIVFTFFSCGYLDVSVPRVRFLLYRMTGSLPPGCPIRTSATHRAFASYRGFSQLITSFFASESLGIPHAPFSDFVISSNASGKCHCLFRLAYCFLYTICSSVTRNLRLYILRYISLPVLSMSSFLGDAGEVQFPWRLSFP